MKVTLFKKNPNVYSCNVYLIRGNWNAIDDVNTMIDTGTDGFFLEELSQLSTGVGKRRVEQVILTHEHFDHSGGLKFVKSEYNPKSYAVSMIQGIDEKAVDGMELKVGDRIAQILYTPGHSNDSICIYVPQEHVLFSGDTALNIKTPGGSYSKEYVEVLERLLNLDIRTVYSGHDEPVTEHVHEMLKMTYNNVISSHII